MRKLWMACGPEPFGRSYKVSPGMSHIASNMFTTTLFQRPKVFGAAADMPAALGHSVREDAALSLLRIYTGIAQSWLVLGVTTYNV